MHLGGQGHGEGHHLLHAFSQKRRGALRLLWRALDEQLVVHLQNQRGLHVLPAQGLVHAHHGQLDDVRGCALDGGVHGRPAAKLPNDVAGGSQFRQIAPPPQQGFRVAPLLAQPHRFVHEALHAGILGEVPGNELLGLLLGDAGVSRQPKTADAVNQPEVHRLGPAAQGGSHLRKGHVEDLAGGAGVDVLPRAEGLHQGLVPGEVRHEPQLNLAVVRVQEHPALSRHKGPANLPALGGAHGNVLQIRLAGGDAPGGRGHLVKGGMDAPLGAHQAQQALDIGAVELGELAVAQQRVDDLRGNVPEILQHLRGGGIALLGLFPVGQLQTVKEHLPQLLGAVQVEVPHPRRLIHLLPAGLNLGGVALAQGAQGVPVYGEARLLHAEEHVAQGQFDFLEQLFHPVPAGALFLPAEQAHQAPGVRGEAPQQRPQGVALFLGIEHVGPQHGVPVEALGQGQAVAAQGVQELLSVVHHHRPGQQRRGQRPQGLRRVHPGGEQIPA